MGRSGNLKLTCAQAIPWLVLAGALLLFTFPLFTGKTLTNYGDLFVLSPWNAHPPKGWAYDQSIDGTPRYAIHASDLLNSELVRERRFFSWNPYVGFGAPWLGSIAGPYFPLKFLAYLWPDYWRGADIVRLLLFFIAGAGNYLLLRSLGVGPQGALFSGLTYMLCERLFLMTNMPNFNIEPLLPVMLYAIHEMVKAGSVRHMALAGIIGGSQFLGGFPEASFVFAVTASLFFLFVIAGLSREQIKRGVALGFLAATFSLLIGGIQIGEFFRYLPVSAHTHEDHYGSVTARPLDLLNLLVPHFFGAVFQPSWTGLAWNHLSYSVFCGVSSLILSIGAILNASSRYVWFFAALGLVVISYDYGCPLFNLIGQAPLFDRMSIAWNAFLIPFTISVLAGFGLHALIIGRYATQMAIFGASAALYTIALALLCWILGSSNYAAMFHALLPAGIALVATIVSIALERYRIGTPLLVFVLAGELLFCASGLKYMHFYSTDISELPSERWIKEHVGHERIFGLKGIYPANTLNPSRVRDARHLDAMYPNLYVDYIDAIWPGARQNVYRPNQSDWLKVDDPLLDTAAIKYVIAPTPLAPSHPSMQSLTSRFVEVYRDADAVIFRNDRAVPRVRFAGTARPAPSTPALLRDALADADVLIEGLDAPQMECPSSVPVTYLVDIPAEVIVHLSAPCRGFVVLADTFFPGWKAYVDGVEQPIRRANYAFRAVEVGPGAHTVAFLYRPWTITFGVPIAIGAFLCAAIIWLASFAKLRAIAPVRQ